MKNNALVKLYLHHSSKQSNNSPALLRNMEKCLKMILKKYLIAWYPGPQFNIKMTSYQYRKFHCGDKTILRPSYLHNRISYTGKMISLYWIRALLMTWAYPSPKSWTGMSPDDTVRATIQPPYNVVKQLRGRLCRRVPDIPMSYSHLTSKTEHKTISPRRYRQG